MDKKYKNPEVRFKGFTEDWNLEKLEKLANFSKGRGYSKGDLIESGTPIILYGRLYTKYQTVINKVDTFAIPKEGSVYSNGNEVIVPASGETPEDIVIASAVLKKDVLLGGDLNIIIPNDSLNSVFLALSISNGKVKKDLVKRAQGKSVVHIRNNDLKEAFLNFPDIAEQNTITSFFQNLDNLITLHQKKYDKLVILKKAMLVKMFPKKGALVPEIRFKGLTEDWKREILSELGDFKSNGVDKKIIPSEHPVSLLNYMDVYNSRYLDANNCKELMQVTAKTSQLNDNNVLKNDIFFTPSSETPEDIGRVMVIENDLPNTVYSYHLMRFRPKLNVFYTFFPNYCFASEHVRKQLVLSAQGVQRFTLSKPAFEELTVLIPSLKEQQKIGDYFKNLDNQIALNKTQLKKLNNIKQACFSKMFVAHD